MFAALDVNEIFQLLFLFFMLILPGLKGLLDGKKKEKPKLEPRRRLPQDEPEDDPFERLLRGEEVVVRKPPIVEPPIAESPVVEAPAPPAPTPPKPPQRPRLASDQPSPSAVPLPFEALPSAAAGGREALTPAASSLPSLGSPLASERAARVARAARATRAVQGAGPTRDRSNLADWSGLEATHDPYGLGARRGRRMRSSRRQEAAPAAIGACSLRADTDWRRALVLAEVLGPPVSLRGPSQAPRF